MKTMLRVLVVLLPALAALGCPPAAHPKRVELYPRSGAPPARHLEVVNTDERHAITVTSGVAFAIGIADDCAYPKLKAPTLTIADAAVLRGRMLSRGTSETEWVLWGVKVGRTTLTLSAECASQTYDVTVVAPS